LTVRPRLLIDENLSVQLPRLVHERGYECAHVRDLGLLSVKDWDLLKRISDEDWTLVTNNVEEFRTRYRRKADLHAGVVFLVNCAGSAAQRSALTAALDDIDLDGNLTNTEMLVEPRGDGYRVRRFDLP
jgi:predicted nuclease of predicted toxin-antitoxin system